MVFEVKGDRGSSLTGNQIKAPRAQESKRKFKCLALTSPLEPSRTLRRVRWGVRLYCVKVIYLLDWCMLRLPYELPGIVASAKNLKGSSGHCRNSCTGRFSPVV